MFQIRDNDDFGLGLQGIPSPMHTNSQFVKLLIYILTHVFRFSPETITKLYINTEVGRAALEMPTLQAEE